MPELAVVLPIAHAGHWAFYVAPILIVVAAVILSAIRERRAAEGPPQSVNRD